MDRDDKPIEYLRRSWCHSIGLDRLAERDRRERISFFDWGKIGSYAGQPEAVWLGHGSILLVWDGRRLLVDPVFASYVGPVPRRCPVPSDWDKLQPDAILLTHAHMDHLHVNTLKKYSGVPLILPAGSERFLTTALKRRAIALQEHESHKLGQLSIHSVPARHGGWRFPWQRGCRASGYVVSRGVESVYISGDTAYGPHFRAIGAKYRIRVAVLPIGAYAPRWFLKSRHLNPEEAVQAWSDLGADRVIPYHFGTYRLSLEGLDEPLPRFAISAAESGCDWYLPIGLP